MGRPHLKFWRTVLQSLLSLRPWCSSLKELPSFLLQHSISFLFLLSSSLSSLFFICFFFSLGVIVFSYFFTLLLFLPLRILILYFIFFFLCRVFRHLALTERERRKNKNTKHPLLLIKTIFFFLLFSVLFLTCYYWL